MDDTGPAHGGASVTAARWALGGATAALVALASGATALLVVTSTTAVGLPVEERHPLPGTTAGGGSGSADVLLLPGGSHPTSGTRARRAGPGSDDPLLVLPSAGSRSTATLTGLTGLAARDSSDGSSPPASELLPSAGGARDAAPAVTDERPETERPQRPAGTPAAEPRPQAPAEDDDASKGKGKGKGAAKEKDGPQEEDEGRGRDVAERSATDTSSARPDKHDVGSRPQHAAGGGGNGTSHHTAAGPPADAGRTAGAGRPAGH